MKRTGPDSLSSWIIAVGCCFINMMVFGMARLSGVLFVASVPRFHVTREEASFPYTFSQCIRNTSGPLVGYLGQKFGVRAVTSFGCLIATVGVGTCFLAENIPTITVLWGGLFGLGFGLGNILLPISINQYFDKKRATASGISFSGACIGSFILPPIVEVLIDTYGLSGTFLVLSGFVLSCFPAALLLKKPNFEINAHSQNLNQNQNEEKRSITRRKNVRLYTVETPSATPQSLAGKSSSKYTAKNYSEDSRHLEVPENANKILTYEERIKALSTQTLLSHYSIRMSDPNPLAFEAIIENSKGRRRVDHEALESDVSSVKSNKAFNGTEKDVTLSHSTPVSLHKKESPYTVTRTLSIGSSPPFCKQNIDREYSKSYGELYSNFGYQADEDDNFKPYGDKLYDSTPSFTPSISASSEKGENKSTLKSFSVIFNPLFILIALTNAVYSAMFVCMITVIVDFARDIDVGATNEKYVIMSLSVGDLIGRLGLGWVTDEGYMTRSNFAAFCFFCQGLTCTIIAWSTGFTMLMAMAALYGLSEAGLIFIFPLILAEFIEDEKQTVAISTSHFLSGPLCLAVAPLIGFFRDDIGSYDYIFYGMGVISLVCTICWLFAPCIARCRRTR